MASISIASVSIPNWQGATTGIALLVYVNSPFTAASGTFYEVTVPSNLPHSGAACIGTFYQEFPCTVSGTTLTIPAITLDSTTDSPDDPNATYSAVLWDFTNGQPVQGFGSQPQFHVPASPASTTWSALFLPTAVVNGNAVTVGTVTSLSAGESPTATISGSNPYLLNLGIPAPTLTNAQVQALAPVQSVAGRTGAITLTAADVTNLASAVATILSSPGTITGAYTSSSGGVVLSAPTTGATFNVGSLAGGSWAANPNTGNASICNVAMLNSSASSYALIQGPTGHTYLNAAPGTGVHFMLAGAEMMTLSAS